MTLLKKLASMLALSVLAVGPAMSQSYPDRPITLIVPWAAGGGTDAIGRIVATVLERELGQPVNVVNRTGGGGIVGHTEIAYSPADGYTLGVATTELSMYHWVGTSPLNYQSYTPLALIAADPEAIFVRADGPSVDALFDQIKGNPGSVMATGANLGGIAHLSWAGLLVRAGFAPSDAPWVPSDGSSLGLQQLVAGAVNVVATTLPDAKAMTDAGEVKPIVLAAESRIASAPDVPTAEEALGTAWSAYAWRGIVAPSGLPEDVAAKLEAAIEVVVESDEFTEFMDARQFGVDYRDGAGFEAFLAGADASLGEALQAVGLAR